MQQLASFSIKENQRRQRYKNKGSKKLSALTLISNKLTKIYLHTSCEKGGKMKIRFLAKEVKFSQKSYKETCNFSIEISLRDGDKTVVYAQIIKKRGIIWHSAWGIHNETLVSSGEINEKIVEKFALTEKDIEQINATINQIVDRELIREIEF